MYVNQSAGSEFTAPPDHSDRPPIPVSQEDEADLQEIGEMLAQFYGFSFGRSETLSWMIHFVRQTCPRPLPPDLAPQLSISVQHRH